MSSKPLIVKNLSKSFKKKTIIDDLSFELDKGKIYGFLGPNGAGKTTTIRMLVSLLHADKGEIIVNGANMKTERNKALSNIGAVVENPEMYNLMSGLENMQHFSRMHTPKISRERINELVSFVELEKAITDKVKTYSLGMKQRLGIAQALLHKPSILILDEPTNGLDPKGIRELRSYLRTLADEEGVTVLVSTHLLSEAEMMCDEVLIIQDGKFVKQFSMTDSSKSEQQKVKALFRATSNADLIPILEEYGRVEEDKKYITLSGIEQDQIPTIIKAATDRGILLYEVILKDTLEDQFLELTGGEDA
ncbi:MULTISPECIES: ABC transporter ATP-binding protein [Pontibacillus]|uniref:ABC transporter ATP-binding protein n=1 Tax=Pontibacillus chungwhensis TaxID=265426 RepID=A0ABY8V3J8_9BACI|nr:MULTISPECIES: ABC transporter ATP-binding protein [Pontibacillus]MCD5325970.1 ABC transporter ATP-binding protein [Pontibacillus sp. HN14]WIF98426.1 ABC transporter ATP-binding protein [Pontibacillus chungwhensis]